MTDLPPRNEASLIKNLSIFTASVVSLMTGLQAWSSMRINQSLEQAKRRQAFSEQILAHMDNLTGDNETKGKVALVGIYVNADTEKDKLNIANIAFQSDKTSLRDAAAFLLQQECRNEPEQAFCTTALELLAREEDISVQRQVREQEQERSSENGTPASAQRVTVPPIQPSPVAIALEEITTAKIAQFDLEGWIYIGKSDSSGRLKGDRTVNSSVKPEADSDVTTITSVYLRDQGTIRTGSSLGIIPKGQKLKVYAIRSTPLGVGVDAVWAKVRTQKGAVEAAAG